MTLQDKSRFIVSIFLLALAVLAGCESSDDETSASGPCLLPETRLLTFEELPENPDPTDPFTMLSGAPVNTPDEWHNCRRPELLKLFQHYTYGYVPERPPVTVTTRHEGPFPDYPATLRLLSLSYPPAGTPPIELLVVTPNNNAGHAVPVILGLNFFGNHTVTDHPEVPLTTVWVPSRGTGVVDNRATEESRGSEMDRWPILECLRRGYGVATFYHGDVDPDFDDFSNGVHPFFYDDGQTEPGEHEWRTLAAWAWGLTLAVDALEGLRDGFTGAPVVDSERLAVMGHSRNGKAALLAGALDERISMVIANQSGCVGAALSRDKTGETVQLINTFYPWWFNRAFKQFNEREEKLPLDQHLLLAMIAPRPLLVLSATTDYWSDPDAEFRATLLASEVFAFLGEPGLGVTEMPPPNTLVSGNPGYHIRPGNHGIGIDDWRVMLDYADAAWSR